MRNYESFYKKYAISLGKQFIKVMKTMNEDKYNKLFKYFELDTLNSIVNHLENDNRAELFNIINHKLSTDQFTALLATLTEHNIKSKILHQLENRVEDAMFLYLSLKICKAYPLEARNSEGNLNKVFSLQDKIIPFDKIQQIIKKNTAIEITEVSEFMEQGKRKNVNQRFLKLAAESYEAYTATYPDIDKRKGKQLKRIMTFLQKQSFTEEDQNIIDHSHFEVNEILMQHEKEQNERFVRQNPSQEQIDYLNVLNYFRILLDPLVSENIFTKNIFTHLSLTNTLPKQKTATSVASKQKMGVKPPISKKNPRTPPKLSKPKSPRSHTPGHSKPNSPRLLTKLPLETNIPEVPKTGLKLFDKQPIVNPLQRDPSYASYVKELIDAIVYKNTYKVDFMLSESEEDINKLKMLLSERIEGQTLLHICILQLNLQMQEEQINSPQKKVKIKNLEAGIILARLLTAHVKADVKIKNEHHLNHNKVSPMQFAMTFDERIAFFIASQYKHANQNKLIINTPKAAYL
jgi:hypothetical protein